MNSQLKIAIYTGKGASHSWIWLVETLARYGFKNIQFTSDISDVNIDLLVVSGGDPFAIFSHIRKQGVSRIRKFIEKGGTYIGICAGAYFALKFHDDPSPWLNLVEGEISNLSGNPPPNIRLPYKYTVPYKDQVVFHPVRDEVVLQYKGTTLTAPLYGGPAITAADAVPLASYKKFTKKTQFLCNEKAASEVLLHTSALVFRKFKKGQLLLFGPHFEHPHFLQANHELVEMLSQVQTHHYPPDISGSPAEGFEKRAWLRDTKRWVSNGRLAAFGLERHYWKIGEKIYDPERLAYFFETCFHLIKRLEREEQIFILKGIPEDAKTLALRTRTLGADVHDAEILLEGLKKVTSDLYSLYFSTLLQPQLHQTL